MIFHLLNTPHTHTQNDQFVVNPHFVLSLSHPTVDYFVAKVVFLQSSF